MAPRFRCVIHGSLRKHLREMGEAMEIFQSAGIEVLAPQMSGIVKEEDGFLFFKGEEQFDPRLIELMYLKNLRELGENGFSYFVNPGGYIGKSASYELGIAQATNVPCFFLSKLIDHPAYIGENAVWKVADLAEYVTKHGGLPNMRAMNDSALDRLWKQMIVPGSVVTAGAIIEYANPRGSEREVLLVKTHKWGHRFSIVGGKVRRRERVDDALRREVKEETGLDGLIGKHICTFDQIRNSGYYNTSTQHLFVDNVVRVDSRRVVLNEEAQDYIWMPVKQALAELPIEPNARHTLELYQLGSRL
ncbi:MAG: NUDIX domain-containing protein [Patescibacteria group bacterium]